MEFCDPYGWHRLDHQTLHDVRDKLKDFETMTWREILWPGTPGRTRNHAVSIEKMSATAQARLRSHHQGLSNLVSLRLTGRQRVWGILSGGVLHLLWWDPDHAVCPSLGPDN